MNEVAEIENKKQESTPEKKEKVDKKSSEKKTKPTENTRPKVLVVDDEKKILIVARKIFTSAGFEVIMCEHPEEALEVITNQGPIPVILSDNRLPIMRGTELLEKVKLLSPNTVRILTTAFYDKQLIEDIVNKAEVFRFLKKPIDFKQAVDIVQQSVGQYELNVLNENLKGDISKAKVQYEKLEEEKESIFAKLGNQKKFSKMLVGIMVLVICVSVGFTYFLNFAHETQLEETKKVFGDWVLYEDGTALDSVHDLMWMTKDFRNFERRNPKSWEEALKWVDKINKSRFAGYNDWRVPTIKEYQQTFDPDRTKLAFDKNKDYPVGYPKVFADGGGYGFWSSEQVGESSARYFFFIGGYEKTVKKSYNSPTMSVRLVRSAK